MWKVAAVFFGVVLAGVACGSSIKAGPSSAGDTNTSTVENGNVLFVIPTVDNNVIEPTITGPQVANFTVADTVSYQYPVFQGVAGVNATILLNSTANACTDANTNNFHLGETQLTINITDLPDMSINANTYVFPAGADAPYEIASVTYAVVQSPCYYNSTSLISGQVVITDVEADSLSGNYNLVFSTGALSGNFTTSPTCAAVGTTPATAPSCN